MTNVAVLNKTSNLVMPSHYVELDREEMSYVEGGLSLSSEGLYLSYDDIMVFSVVAGTNMYALATIMSAATAWICSTGIGAVLWGLFSVSSCYIAIQALSAFSQGKGLMISVEFAKIWFLSIPCGLNFQVK